MDFELRQRTNSKKCQFLCLHNLEVFALSGRELSKSYAVLPGIWSCYEAHRVVRVPKPVVYSYITAVYCKEPAALLLAACIVEAEYVTLPLGALFQVVQYGLASRSALDEMMSACAGRGTLLRVPWVLDGQWFCYGTISIVKDMDLDLVVALLAIACCGS